MTFGQEIQPGLSSERSELVSRIGKLRGVGGWRLPGKQMMELLELLVPEKGERVWEGEPQGLQWVTAAPHK